jgi:hypothetical protein
MSTTATKPRGYELHEVPARPDGSRFALNQTAAGIRASRDEAVANAYDHLLRERIAESQAPAEPFKTVKLHAVVELVDGTYELRPRGSVAARPTHVTTYSGRFSSRKPSPAIVDELLLGDAATVGKVRDETVWESLLLVAESCRASGRALRSINDATAAAVLLRQGIVKAPFELPHIPTPHE